MYLKSLTLKGFKSFADRTHMVFDPGLTVVVGPNGSGKSNVSDAILWVLGEQSAKMLRGQAMEDVVFSGSSARKPVGVAEVTLVLDNSDHTLPVEFSEVGVTRRMYRSGESEYLINGAPARLMDIQDILHDSGLGKDTHSIISQGKLDSILSSRPEERRALIEEAAGISKHRRRKERALKKLADMDKNLVRARDVSREMNRQLRPLERQVDRARRFSELDGRLSELTCQLAVDDLRRLQREWNALQGRSRQAQAAVELAEFRSKEKARELEKLQSLLEQNGLFLGDLGAQRRRLADILGRLESDMRLLEEKGRNMVGRLSETRMTLSALERQRGEATTELACARDRAAEAAGAKESLEASVRELEPAAREATERRRRAGSELSRLTEAQRQAQRKLDAATLAHAKLSDELANAEVEDSMFASRLDQIAETLEQADSALASRRDRLSELDDAVAKAGEDAARDRDAIAQAQAAASSARMQRESARRALDDARSELAQAQATLKALLVVERASRGDGDSLEGRVLASERLSALVRARLSELVEVPAELDALVERVLGSAVGALVVDGDEELASLAGAACSLDGSGALELLELAQAQRPVPEGPGRPLVDELGAADGALPLVRALLGSVRVVDDVAAALAARREQPALTYVTADGSVTLAADGRLTVGHQGAELAGTLARARQIAELKDSVPQLEDAVCRASDALSSRESALEGATAALASAREASAASAAELSRLGAERSSLASEVGRLEAQVSRARDEHAQVCERRSKAREKTRDSRPRLEELKAQADEAQGSIDALSGSLDAASTERRDASREEERAAKRLADARLELATTTERLRHLTSRAAELEGRISDLDSRREAAERSTRSLEVLRLRVDPLHERYEALRACARTWAERLRDRASLAEADSDSLKRTIGDAREAAAKAADELESARADASELKVSSGKLEVRVEQAVAAITADGRHALEDALEMPEPEDREAAEHEVERLRRQIEQLGPVNQVAMEEYTTLKERCDYVAEQLSDLERARASLTKITAAIDRKMRKRFLETFEAVNANFVDIFSVLFPGGVAHIEMTDPDHPAETGIEIVAQPRGKRIAKMTLMSGGEKSLTALALLFAVYRTRTVPFYVFDEVEAALDDSNLDKLLDAIERLKRDTQLIVISHQRRTMEQADVLYGISMQADGVSHVVSQRLDKTTGKVVDA